MKLKSVILLFNLVVSVFVVQGAITTMRQKLDEFSFKKGVKVGGGLSFSKEGCARAAAWRAVQKYPSVQQLAKHAEFVYLCKNLNIRNYGLISESERGCVHAEQK